MSADDVRFGFRRVTQALISSTAAVAGRLGLSLSEVALIEHVAATGTSSPGALGQSLGLPSATVTGLLDRLETSGYLVRRRSASDGRRVEVALGPAAVAVQRSRAALRADVDALIDRRSARQQRDIAAFLAELADALDGDAGAVATPHPPARSQPTARSATKRSADRSQP